MRARWLPGAIGRQLLGHSETTGSHVCIAGLADMNEKRPGGDLAFFNFRLEVGFALTVACKRRRSVPRPRFRRQRQPEVRRSSHEA